MTELPSLTEWAKIVGIGELTEWQKKIMEILENESTEVQQLEEELMRVFRMMKKLPRAAPEGHRGWWPDIVPERSDYPRDPDFVSLGEALDPDLIDKILDWFTQAPLSIDQRKIIQARLGRGYYLSWRKIQRIKIGKIGSHSHEYYRVFYADAVKTLLNWLKTNGKEFS